MITKHGRASGGHLRVTLRGHGRGADERYPAFGAASRSRSWNLTDVQIRWIWSGESGGFWPRARWLLTRLYATGPQAVPPSSAWDDGAEALYRSASGRW